MSVLLCTTPVATAFNLCSSSAWMQRHGLHHSLNIHDVTRSLRENVKTNITLHMVGRCENHPSCRWPWLVLLSRREKSRRGVWQVTVVVDRDAVNYVTYFQEIGTSTRHNALADTSVNFSIISSLLFNGNALIIIFITRTTVDRRISQTAHPSWNENLPIAAWHRPTRAKHWNTAAAIRTEQLPSECRKKTWRSVSKLSHTTQRRQCTHCTHTKNAPHARIESLACIAVFVCVRCVFRFFNCVASRVSVAFCATAWKLHVGLCDIQLFTFLWWISGSAVRRNVVMSNYMTSNYVTLRRQRPVGQFSWCPQHDMSPLWPVIKQQDDSTSDRQMVTSDGDGRSPAWPVITLSLRTSVIGLGHFRNSRKTVT